MFPLKCVECGCDFEGMTMFARYCGGVCRQRVYRKTDKGKASVVKSNAKVKVRDRKKKCIHCGEEFVTARKNRKLCDVCSKGKGAYYAQKKHRAKYPERVRARGLVGKRVYRGSVAKKICSMRDCNEIGQQHHPDYTKPEWVIWICKDHHYEVHAGGRYLC